MTRRKLTDDEKDARLERRASARAARAAVTAEQHAWWQNAAQAARKRYERAVARRAKAAKKAAKKDKSPKITVTSFTVSKHGTPIASTVGEAVVHGRRITGNHEYRRAVGQRSHYGRDMLGMPGPKPRRRDLPGAVAKRAAVAQARMDAARSRWSA